MFELDERLSSTGLIVGEWPLSTVLLKNDRNYPWFVLVPRKAGLEEWYQLNDQEHGLLMQEIQQLSLLIKAYYQPQKINVASLGNSVRQFHVHCVGRSEHDPLWPQSIWQNAYEVLPYSEVELKRIANDLEQAVKKIFQFDKK